MVVWMFAWVTAGSNEPGVHCGSGRGPARKWHVPIFIESVTCFGSCTASNPPVRGSTDPFEVAAELADAPLDAPPPKVMVPDLQPLTVSSNTITAALADTALVRMPCAPLGIRLMPVTVADRRPYVSQRMRPLRRAAARTRRRPHRGSRSARR